jgi:hypothetical protein
MRELTLNEIAIVSGAGDECPPGNDIGAVMQRRGLRAPVPVLRKQEPGYPCR